MRHLARHLFSASCVLVSACNLSGTRDLDFRASTATLADVLGQCAPKPCWALPITGHGLDQIVCWQDQVVVALAHRVVVAASLETGLIRDRLIAVVVQTGQQLWEATLPSDTETVPSIQATPFGVLVVTHQLGGTSVSLREWRSGRVQWERKLGEISDLLVGGDTAVAGAGSSVLAWSLVDNTDTWRVPVAARQLVEVSMGLLAVDRELTLLNPITGVPLWRLVPRVPLSAPLVVEGGTRVLIQEGALIFIVDGGGKVVWERELPATPTFVRWTSDDLFLATQAAAGTGDLACLDPATGSERWVKSMDDRVQSVPVIVGAHIVITMRHGVRMLSRHDGAEAWRSALSGAPDVERLPDRIIPRPDHVVIVTEDLVTSLRTEDGGSRWSIAVPAPRYEDAHQGERIFLSIVERLAKELTPEAEKTAGAVPMSVERRTTPQALASRLQLHRDMLARMKAARGRAAGEHHARMRQKEPTSRLAERLHMQLGVASMILGLFDARKVVNAYGALHQAVLFEGRKRHLYESMSSIRDEPLIARPFAWSDGSGVLLIDIDHGTWREFITRPDEAHARKNLVGLEPFLVVGSNLLTCGVELDSARWRALPILDPNTRRQNVTMNRSILAMPLAAHDFLPVGDYATRSLAMRGRPWRGW